MITRFRYAILAAAIAIPSLMAQSSDYKPPMTAWGEPDLQGVYLNRHSTPLERPQNLGAKEFYTLEEMQQRQDAAANRSRRKPQPGTSADAHYDLEQFGLDSASSGMVPNLRTSLITGSTGRLPNVLPEAKARLDAAAAAKKGHEYDGPEMRGTAERCIMWSFEGPPIMPGGYNPNLDIHQGPGFVAVRYEMMGGARIIPTDGRPHQDPGLKMWYGDSVGHWEGNTLVVDTTNFKDMTALGRGTGEQLHVVERFTRTAPDILTYQFTVSDPTVWEESWSGEYPMLLQPDGQIYEYDCQEGNYGMPNILRGERVKEAQESGK